MVLFATYHVKGQSFFYKWKQKQNKKTPLTTDFFRSLVYTAI